MSEREDELRQEQARLDETLAAFEEALRRLSGRARPRGVDEFADEALERMRRDRIRAYTEAGGPLYFGRIDPSGGRPLYIGRHVVVDGNNQVLVLVAVVGAASALANNLPVSVCAGSLLGAGASAYGASIGLALGSLAMRQGSVATLVAVQMAGAEAPPLPVRRLAPLAAAGALVATLLVSASL